MKRLCSALPTPGVFASTSVLPLAARIVTHAADSGLILTMMTEATIWPAEQTPGNRVIADANAGRYPAVEAQVMSGKPIRDPFEASAGRGLELTRR